VIERFPFFDNASHFPSKQPDDEDFFKTSGRRIEGAVFEEDAGYVISPDLATQNLRRAGEREGVLFRLKCEVRDIKRTHSKAFRVETKDGSIIESQVLINAGGPHSAIINRMAGVKLPLETRALRREVHSLRNPLFDEVKGSPVPIIGDLDGGVYSRPEAGGRGIIVGSTDPDCDIFDWVEDPDDYFEGVTGTYWERQTLRLMKRFPQLEQGRPRGISALYDVTVKDWYPICDRTDIPGYYVCIGTSGSSFKTSPVLGMLMTEIIEASEKGRDIDHDPIQLTLPRTGVSIDTRFLSRLRGKIETIGTVFG
jgi:sarcosine oxidase subunit beta